MALTTIITSSTMIKNHVKETAKAEQMIRQKSHSLCFYSSPVFFFSCCCLSWRVFITLTMLKHHFLFDWCLTYSNRIAHRLYDLPLKYGHLTPLSKSYRYSVLIFLTLFFGSYFRHLSINANIFFCISFLIQFLFEVIGANKTKK